MRRTIGLIPALLLLANPAAAGGVDVTKPFLCAVTEAVECDHDGVCARGGADALDFPSFIEVDAGRKLIRERDGERKTQIRSQDRVEGHTILQGIQDGRAWSLSLSESSGMMSISSLSGEVGFLVFGVCTGL